MRKLMFLIVLGIIGAGQVKADSTCVAASLATYVSQGSCNIGGLDFSHFSTTSPAGLASAGPTTGLTTSQIEITPTTVGGVGLIITFVGNTDEAFATGAQDIELPFEVNCVGGSSCLNNVFMSITGSVTGTTAGGFTPGADTLTETYCLGGSAPPPTAPCPSGSGKPTTQDILPIGLSSPGTLSRTDTFSSISQLSMDKDIQAIGNNGTATITQVQDLFAVSTPEPGTLLLLGSGLAGLALLSRRRRRSLV
jgi:hypothetical protein